LYSPPLPLEEFAAFCRRFADASAVPPAGRAVTS
jgi:hypothetical protein